MPAPELKFQKHIADFLVRVHKYGVLEQGDITDTEHSIAEDQLWAFLKATQADSLEKLTADYGTDARDEVFKALRHELEHTPLWMLLAAIEFARRRIKPEGSKIETPADLLPHVRHYADRKQEHFLCASVNGANEILNSRVVSIGLLDRSPVHPREVFADALADRGILGYFE